MKNLLLLPFLLLTILISSCKKDNPVESDVVETDSLKNDKAEVVINDIPYKTDKFLRIPYTIKIWEYEKDGLVLEQIMMLDDNSNTEIFRIEKADMPVIYRDSILKNEYIETDILTSYYLSIQIPITLGAVVPAKISHIFTFKDTVNNSIVTHNGAEFYPRINESPITISSPVKGKNLLFVNQSSMDYHFNSLFFIDGKIYRDQRFAFDYLQIDDEFTNYYSGDPKLNTSYYNYRDTIYAVADGKVVALKDGRPENNGDAQNITFSTLDEFGGNYLILDIGEGHYAIYCHCVPNSFMVSDGSIVKEGDPIALIGNSGNSTAPHLHFEITDAPHLLHSIGIPFVLKNYTKTGEIETGPGSPVKISNSMMEQLTVFNIE